MQVNTLAIDNKSASAVEIPDAIFARDYNEALVHQVVTAFYAKARAGTHAQKTRAEVRGGGAKPWRQKGTGRARAGTTRGPIWRKGGVTFAAVTQDYSQKVNRKMYRNAISVILSELLRSGRLVVVDSFTVPSPKTKELLTKLHSLDLDDVLIIADTVDENLYLAARNVYKIGVCDVAAINPVCLVGFKKVLITVAALKQLEEVLA